MIQSWQSLKNLDIALSKEFLALTKPISLNPISSRLWNEVELALTATVLVVDHIGWHNNPYKCYIFNIDPRTLTPARMPFNRHGLLQHYQIGQSKFTWAARSHPAIGKVLHNIESVLRERFSWKMNLI